MLAHLEGDGLYGRAAALTPVFEDGLHSTFAGGASVADVCVCVCVCRLAFCRTGLLQGQTPFPHRYCTPLGICVCRPADPTGWETFQTRVLDPERLATLRTLQRGLLRCVPY